MKHAKKAFLASVLSLVLCISMLVGTTYAWFTDSVTSAGNIIKAGTLQVELGWAEGQDEVPDTDAGWTNAETGAIFDYSLWEPGFVQVRHVRIANTGSLALKYQLRILPEGELEVNNEGHTLADAIDVYYKDPAEQAVDRDHIPGTRLGTLAEFLAANQNETTNTASGVLYPQNTAGKASEHQVTITLKMREDAGNEYQDMTLGGAFSVQLLATQYTYEKDSFDELYDEFAEGISFSASAVYSTSAPTVVNTGSTAQYGNAKVTLPTAGVKLENGSDLAAGENANLEIEEVDTPANFTVTDATSNTTTFEVSLVTDSGDKIVSSDEPFSVELNIGILELQGFAHNGVAMEEVNSRDTVTTVGKYYYDVDTGIIYFLTDSFSPFTAVHKYSGGLGSEDYPYLISSAKDFYAIIADYEYDEDWKQGLNIYDYRLTQDIAIENYCMNISYVMKAEASHDSYANAFFGTFDGGNHTISFKWDDEKADETAMATSAISLFGELVMATVKNLKVDCDISTGKDVGVLSSYTYYGTTIENVEISGTIRSEARTGGGLGGIALATWELEPAYPALFKDVTVSADIYFLPVERPGPYIYVAPFIAQAVGLSQVSFINCKSTGSLHVAHVEGVTDSVTEVYTGAFYALNPGYPDANPANCEGNVNACENDIAPRYNLHIFTGLPENAWE